MRVYLVLLGLLACLGIGLILYTRLRNTTLSGDQAGRAFVEQDDGTLAPSTGQRAAQRTQVAARPGDDEDWLTKFELIERSGETVASAELAGQPYVAGFFFSTCPSICVRQNGKMQQLQEKFRGQPVRFLSISCDPEVDRPEVLREYAKRFDADPNQWLFLTGDMPYIQRVGAEVFRLGVTPRGHPEKFALMDGRGELFGLYTWSDDGQWSALERDIEQMLANGGVLEQDASDAQGAQTANDHSEAASAEIESSEQVGAGETP